MRVLNVKIRICIISATAMLIFSSCKAQEQTLRISENETAENYELSTEYDTSLETESKSELPVPLEEAAVPQTLKEFYENSLFIGDSIMLGFSKYLSSAGYEECDFIDSSRVYGIGSYSVRLAVSDISENDVNLVYMGKELSIEDLCSKTNSDSVYILLGMNDIAVVGIENTFENYKALISKIKAKNQGIKCNIISITYMLSGSEKKTLNNENIRKLNSLLKEYCDKTSEAEYIDIAEPLSDNGFLKSVYCSDGYIHQNNAAYSVWSEVLSDFAKRKITESGALIQDYENSTQTTSFDAAQTTEAEEAQSGADYTAFYDDAVFIGDSITVGFSNYLEKNNDLYGSPQFLATVSFAVYHALMPLYETNLHPKYNGVNMRLPDSIAKCGAKKVFVCFGINDLNAHTPEDTFKDYIKLLEEIKEKSPNIRFYIISTTNICSGSESNYLTNKNVSSLNESLKQYCISQNIDFIDIASLLTDQNGALSRKYSADGYVHQNSEAYKIWVEKLNQFAKLNSEV